MDKYQEDLLKDLRYVEYNQTIMKEAWRDCFENEILKIIQNEDITHTKYFVYLEGDRVVSKLEVCENGKYRRLEKVSLKNYSDKFRFDKGYYVIDFDFDNPIISKIKMHFINDLADPLEVLVEYVEADKISYYNKKEKERLSILLDNMKVTHSTGDNLINIRFQNCSPDVTKTKVVLYDTNKQLMGTFVVDEGMFYKSIANLAYGTYYYKVEQYDKNDTMIISTDYISASVVNPHGRNVVRPRF